MKMLSRKWETGGVHYRMKSSAMKAALISVTQSIINMGDYVTEMSSMEFDEETRDIVKMTNDEWFISDRILVTKS